MKRIFEVYRYDPDKDAKPYMQDLTVTLQDTDKMLLFTENKVSAWLRGCICVVSMWFMVWQRLRSLWLGRVRPWKVPPTSAPRA